MTSRITALDIPPAEPLTPETEAYFAKCREKLGLVPNVLLAYAFEERKLRAFSEMYNDLMLGDSGLTKLEREMIAVAVSSINHCYYCLTAHGAAVRQLSGDPALGEMMVMNYRAAPLSPRHQAMLDFAAKLTEAPAKIEEADREALRKAGFSDRDIWDIASVAPSSTCRTAWLPPWICAPMTNTTPWPGDHRLTMMRVWRDRRGRSRAMVPGATAMQPSVGSNPGRATCRKMALPPPRLRGRKFQSSTTQTS